MKFCSNSLKSGSASFVDNDECTLLACLTYILIKIMGG
jgi:hypothetical protein